MKRLLTILLLSIAITGMAADLPIGATNVWTWSSDSLDQSSTFPITGFRRSHYAFLFFICYYQTNFFEVYNTARSGEDMNLRMTNDMPETCPPIWGYRTNNYGAQVVAFSTGTDNAYVSSNQTMLDQSNFCQVGTNLSVGNYPLQAQTGIMSSNHPYVVIIGEPPSISTDGSPTTELSINNACTNAGWTFAKRGVSLWHECANDFTNDYQTNGGNFIGWFQGTVSAGHIEAPGALIQAKAIVSQLKSDLTISECMLDWNDPTKLSFTNQCVITSASKVGNVFTFTTHDNHLAFGFDHSKTDPTNNAMTAFMCDTNLAEAFPDWFCISNIPAGTYTITCDGQYFATATSTTLANHYNMFTNFNGPIGAQRDLVRDDLRRVQFVDTNTLVPGSPSFGLGIVSYGALAFSKWSANDRGDTLIQDMDAKITSIISAGNPQPYTFQQLHNDKQVTSHTFSISPQGAIVASVTASAPTNAFKVPVILDGSASLNCSQYFWTQTNGTQLDAIGYGTPKLMLLSVTNAGTFGFQLVVSDGSNYATNGALVTFIAPTGRTNYIDEQLTANTTTYSIASRNGSGTDGNGYTNFAAAVAISLPGDLFLVRGGVYSNTPIVANQTLLNVTNSGTVTAPIRFEGYNGEQVALVGWGYSDATNSSGLEIGPNYPLLRQTLVFVPPAVNYIQFKGLDLTNCQQTGMTIEGNFCYAEGCQSHDNWLAGITLTRVKASAVTLQGDVLRWCETHNNRHFTGVVLGLEDSATFGYMSDCAVVDCISYCNGYLPNGGARVNPTQGDSQGGGNSGGFWSNKYLADNAYFFPTNGVRNYGSNLYFIRNESWNNCDDGFAFDHVMSLIQDNRSAFNGPTGAQGYKILRYGYGLTFRGDIAYANMLRGYDLRVDTNSTIALYNCTSISNAQQGFVIAGVDSTSLQITSNNIAGYDGAADWPNGQTPNWARDGNNVPPAYRGEPVLISTNVTLPLFGITGSTVKARHDYIDGLFVAALSPATNSPLLRAGVFIPGYHCATADNDAVNPMPATAPGRHWFLAAPDIGALNALSTNVVVPPLSTNLVRLVGRRG